MKNQKNKSKEKLTSDFARQVEKQMAAENARTGKNNTEKNNTSNKKTGSKTNSPKEDSKITVIRILQLVFSVGILVCAVILTVQLFSRRKAEKTYEDLQKNSTEKLATDGDATASDASESDAEKTSEKASEDQDGYFSEQGIYIPNKELNWDELWAVNDEIYAWIYIPGTEVDYPVLQSQKNGEDYYLDHNLDGSTGYPGCIYTQALNSMDFTDFVTVLYGHNMKDGTMFKSLHNYMDEEFFGTNRYIYIYTTETTFVYEIFAAVKFDDRNILMNYDMSNVADRTNFINDLYDNRDMSDVIDRNVSVTADSKIITLSTCLDDSSDSRWLVNGVLLEN
jgi:sortase B